MRLFKKWFVPFTVLATLCFGGMLFADDFFQGVCRRPKIGGFDTEYIKAKRVLGDSTTADINSCEVFITKKGNYLYFHSNFVSEGADNPSKISHKELRDLTLVTANLYGVPEGNEFSPAETRKIVEAHKKHVKYYLDQSLFDSTGTINLELGGAEKIYVLFEGAPPPKPLTRLNPIRGPPYVAEYYPSLFVKVTPSATPHQLFTKLEQQPFKSREIRFVSLLPDSATEAAIKASGVAKIREALDAPSMQTLKDFFRKNTGRVVVVLGHVEGEKFVATDATGKTTQFTLSLAEVEQMAATAGCDVVMLGCSSALAGTPVGVNKPFNPVDAVGRLDKALKAVNYLEFVRTLSNEDMGLVFADTAFDRTTKRIEAEVYVRESGKSEPVVRDRNLAGRVGIVFGIAAIGGGGFGGGEDDKRNGGSGGGEDDKRNGGSGGGEGGSGGTKSGGPTAPGPTNQAANPPTEGNMWLYVILGVFLVIVIGWAMIRSRTA
jgi:hypothetical protein